MDEKQMIQGISADDWARLAKSAKTTPQQIQSQYEAALAKRLVSLGKVTVKAGAPVKSGDCISRDFDITLYDIISLKGNIQFCSSSQSDWTATYHVCLLLAGNSIWCTDATLTPNSASICYSPDFALVKAQFCLAINGVNLCFNVSGNACYRKWTGSWDCSDFNETVFCFE